MTFSKGKISIGFSSDGFERNEFQLKFDSINNTNKCFCKSGGPNYAISKGADGTNNLNGQKEDKEHNLKDFELWFIK